VKSRRGTEHPLTLKPITSPSRANCMKKAKLIFAIAMLSFFLTGLFSCSEYSCPTYARANAKTTYRTKTSINPIKPAQYKDYRAKHDGNRLFKVN